MHDMLYGLSLGTIGFAIARETVDALLYGTIVSLDGPKLGSEGKHTKQCKVW